MTRPPADLNGRYAHWNVGDGKRERYERDLLRMVREEAPHLIGLNETGNDAIDKALGAVVRQTGYQEVRTSKYPGSSHIAWLVAPGVPILKWRLKKLTARTWVGRRTAGSKRTGVAEAKYLLIVVVRVNGRRVKAGCVHFVPSAAIKGNTATRRLHGRQVRQAAYWFARVRRGYISGDVNADQATRTGRMMLHLLRRLGKTYSTATHGRRHIDVFITRGMPATVRELRGYGGDHDPLLLTETTRKKEKS